ncbi:hypothetical protein L1887_53811 [Cichorium endivia]|nr:hypothetical protein L1887_53811 [Cichorium endivia]
MNAQYARDDANSPRGSDTRKCGVDARKRKRCKDLGLKKTCLDGLQVVEVETAEERRPAKLELEGVGLLTLGEGEGGGKVLGHGGASLLDGGDDGLVERLLVGDLGLGVSLLVGGVGEEGGLGLGLGGLVLLEVGVVDLVVDLDVRDVDLGRGGDHVGLVDAADGDTVHLEGAGDEQQTGVELLEEHDALAAEATGEEDEDGTGGDVGLELGGLVDLAAGLGLGSVNRGVEAGGLLGGDEALAAVLGALDGDLLVGGGLLLLLSGALALLELVATLLLVGLGAAEASHVRGDLAVSGHFVGMYAGGGWEGSKRSEGTCQMRLAL